MWLSLHLTILSAIAFWLGAAYGVRYLLNKQYEWSWAVSYMTFVAILNALFRTFTGSYRAATGKPTGVLGEWVTWTALTLQFALGISLLVGLSLAYYARKARMSVENGGR